MAERVRELDDDEGKRLVRIIRRGTGSVVTWRRAQMILLSAQGMPVPKIAEVSFTSADRVRDVIHNFNADGFDSLYPKYAGGRPKTFTLPERREIKKIAKSAPRRARSAVLDLEPDQTRRVPGRRGGWSTTSATRVCACCSERRVSRFKKSENLEAVQGSGLRGEEGSGRASLRDR